MIPPVVKGLAKAGLSAAPKAYKAIRRELELRGVEITSLDLTSLQPEMDSALEILIRNADRPGKALLDYARGLISGRPDWFDESPVSDWIATEKTRGLVKSAARAFFDSQPIEPYREEAAAFFATFEGADSAGSSDPVFDYAVAFVAASITRDFSPVERLMLGRFDGLDAKLDGISAKLDRPPPSARVRTILDEDVTRQRETLRKARFFDRADIQDEARAFAKELRNGEFSEASDEVRANGLAAAARWLWTKGDQQEIEALLREADALGATEDAQIVRAVLLSRDDWTKGVAALAPLDSPARRMAAFQMVVRGRSETDALNWLEDARLSPKDLDSDGRFCVISCRIVSGDWDGAIADARTFSEEDFAHTPALQHVAGLARIASTVQSEFKKLIAVGVPMNAASLPLADDEAGLRERREAAKLLNGAAGAATEFDNLHAAHGSAIYALWLELRDPETAASAREKLDALLSDPETAVLYLPLGVEFDVVLDRDAVERALKREEALNPDGSLELAIARLAMVHSQGSVDDEADYFERHRKLMWMQLLKPGLLEIEVRLLAAAGRIELGRERLREFGDLLESEKREQLATVLDQGPGGPSLAELEAAYSSDPSPIVLDHLVRELSTQGYSDRFFELALEQVRTTRSRSLAERLVRFLIARQRFDKADAVISEVPQIVATSLELRGAEAWTVFRTGRLKDALALVQELRAERDDPNDRTLLVQIRISSGHWAELAQFVEEEWQDRDRRSGGELLNAAQIGAAVGAPRVWDLVREAAAKGKEDPNVLLSCYLLAMGIGRDGESEVHKWFARAAELSGPDGPVQQGSLEDMAKRAPDWDAHVADIGNRLRLGQIPMALAAEQTRRPSLEIFLVPMIANREVADPRRRAIVAALSGVFRPSASPVDRLGFDGNAILALGQVGVLRKVIARPGGIHIPHSTLKWLFQERQRLGFHQPSRIKLAHALVNALGTGRIERFNPPAKSDGALIDQVGAGLASMLTAATEPQEEGPQPLVVRSAPVHRIGSFRGEVVDLAAFADVLASCQALLDKLVERGLLTVSEEERARTFLEQNEKRWDGEPPVEDGTHLYLDDLSVSYLRSSGLMEKLQGAGFKLFVSEREVEEARALIELESRGEAIDAVIDDVRAALAEGIDNGQVHVDHQFIDDELRSHPSIAAIQLAGKVDAIVTDDRFINRHRSMDHGEASVPIWTSLDLLDLMNAQGEINSEELWQFRTVLRQAGYALFPSREDELEALLAGSAVRDGRVIETGELRAFRENLRLTELRGWLSLPDEAAWLQQLNTDLVAAIRSQWRSGISDEVARARSRWLLALADMRNWAGTITDNDGSNIGRFGLAVVVNRLLMSRFGDVPDDAIERMDKWLEEEVVAKLKYEEPGVYAWLLETLRTVLAKRIEGENGDGDASE